jgi:hypothetical protein
MPACPIIGCTLDERMPTGASPGVASAVAVSMDQAGWSVRTHSKVRPRSRPTCLLFRVRLGISECPPAP